MANKPLTGFAELSETIRRKATEGLTFNINDLTDENVYVAEKTGNVCYRYTCANGKVISFWSSNADQVVEAIDDKGNHQVIAGTQILDDGSLIPSDKRSTGSVWDRKK